MMDCDYPACMTGGRCEEDCSAKEPVKKAPVDYSKRVVEIATSVATHLDEIILKNCDECPLPDHDRWLLRGRVLNALFGNHYEMALREGKRLVEECAKRS